MIAKGKYQLPQHASNLGIENQIIKFQDNFDEEACHQQHAILHAIHKWHENSNKNNVFCFVHLASQENTRKILVHLDPIEIRLQEYRKKKD